jgi:hypothetical protein
VTDEPSAGRAPTVNADGVTRSKRAASEIAALVAEQVRDAIEEAERSAQALRGQARDDASARRGAVQDRATEVMARIDELENRLTRMLRELRGEAAHIAKAVDASREGAEDRARYAERFAREDESASRSPASVTEAQPSDAVADEGAESPGAEGERSAERLASSGAAADPDVTPSPAEAAGSDESLTDQPPPAAAAPPGSVLGEAPDARDEHAESAGEPAGEAAAREAWEGPPTAPPAADADAQEESGAEHPPDSAGHRRRPGLFRHRRDG